MGDARALFQRNTKTPSPPHASADRADRKLQVPPRPLKSWFPPHPLERLAGVSSTHHGSSVVVGFQSMIRKMTMAMYSKNDCVHQNIHQRGMTSPWHCCCHFFIPICPIKRNTVKKRRSSLGATIMSDFSLTVANKLTKPSILTNGTTVTPTLTEKFERTFTTSYL